jgi:hypothetical protein
LITPHTPPTPLVINRHPSLGLHFPGNFGINLPNA